MVYSGAVGGEYLGGDAMAVLLTNLRYTVAGGVVLTIVLLLLYLGLGNSLDYNFWVFGFRWLHVLSGVMWVGLLYYFNFVQIPSMPEIADERKAAITQVVAPRALWWFRWSAMATIVTGWIVSMLNGYLFDAYALGFLGGFDEKGLAIGIGMWLGTIMWFNVWFVIWPNQKVALGIVESEGEAKVKAGRTAMLFSRANTLMSVPMLFAMVSAQNIYLGVLRGSAGATRSGGFCDAGLDFGLDFGLGFEFEGFSAGTFGGA